MNKIEQVAKAIFDMCPEDWLATKEQWNAVAKAAIEAMREPTEGMIEAIDDSYGWDSSDLNGRYYIASADPKTNWEAGIDAALKED